MRSFFLAAAASAAFVAAQLRIETPTNLVVCQPALLAWSGGTPPYFPAVIPGGQPGAASLKDFPETSATQLTWNVDLAAGTEVSLRLTDSTGAVNYAERVTIRAGSNTNCLNGNSSTPATGGAAASGASAASAASSAVRSGTAAASSAAVAGAASASSVAGAGASAARSGASAVSSGAVSLSQSGSATPAGARPSASSSSASLAGAKVQLGGVFGVVVGAIGSLLL